MDAGGSGGRENWEFGPKLTAEDTFGFACGPEVPCFTECCGKLDLMLTPYDVLRLKNRLGLTSSDFLDQYTYMRQRTPVEFPQFFMKMDNEERRCPFVRAAGCAVYEDRPGACRIYPVGRGSTRSQADGSPQEFFFLVKEDHCKGFREDCQWRISEWLRDQGMEEYNRVNDLLMELYVRRVQQQGIRLTENHMKMFVMACYNVERFRDFVFRSNFLERFELDEDQVREIEKSDLALLEFAFTWLRFALFGEPTLRIRQSGGSGAQGRM